MKRSVETTATAELSDWVIRHQGEGPVVLLASLSGVSIRLARLVNLPREAFLKGLSEAWEIFERAARRRRS